jgi:hypothetical protein
MIAVRGIRPPLSPTSISEAGGIGGRAAKQHPFRSTKYIGRDRAAGSPLVRNTWRVKRFSSDVLRDATTLPRWHFDKAQGDGRRHYVMVAAGAV